DRPTQIRDDAWVEPLVFDAAPPPANRATNSGSDAVNACWISRHNSRKPLCGLVRPRRFYMGGTYLLVPLAR
ncbi:MAG TPA: hypothetical protein PLS55_03735, partial [Thermogutta sp.]|nr:hypothetical protein [Thermogutta sp.]